MKKRKRTQMTVETRSLVLRRSRQQPARYCDRCEPPALLLEPDEAAALGGISMREVYKLVENGRLHYLEPEGRLLVCPRLLPTRTHGLITVIQERI